MKYSVHMVKHNHAAVSNPLAKTKPPIRGAQIMADLALKIGGEGGGFESMTSGLQD
jgi:hypothetical protein